MFKQKKLKQAIDGLPITVMRDLEKQVSDIMAQTGLFCRVFSRQKGGASAAKKIAEKKKQQGENYKMQDLFGVRIALYFKDDIPICRAVIEKNFKEKGISEDEEKTNNFEPIKLNIVCSLPGDIKKRIHGFLKKNAVDDTFEIQIRTVFSEGWHEIDHDLRYKCKDEWENDDTMAAMSRTFNGIFATLETCNWSIISLFDQLAYEKYKVSDWKAMLRNKLRIRMKNEELDEDIVRIFNENKQVGKDFYKLDREALIEDMSHKTLKKIPKSINNIIYVANGLYVQNEEISSLTPDEIKLAVEKYLESKDMR